MACITPVEKDQILARYFHTQTKEQADVPIAKFREYYARFYA